MWVHLGGGGKAGGGGEKAEWGGGRVGHDCEPSDSGEPFTDLFYYVNCTGNYSV